MKDVPTKKVLPAQRAELLATLKKVELGDFDTKTSSWVKAPSEIRKRGGALYGERRYGRVFVGHNGAQSYYSTRAFRGLLKV